MDFSSLLILTLSLVLTTGLILLLTSIYWSSFSSTLRHSSSHFSQRVQELITTNVERNQFFFKERLNIERQLAFSGLTFRKKQVTFKSFIHFSIVTGVLAFFLALFTTTRNNSYNFTALLIVTIIGFIIPRWYLIVVDGRMQRQLSQEAPIAVAKITSYARSYSNIERAVFEATKELPTVTKRYFEQAWRRKDIGDYKNFSSMMYAIAQQSKNSTWATFAHLCLVEQTLGSSDKLAKLRSIQSRARRLLLAGKIERKNLNAKALKVAIAYLFLVLIWAWDTLFNPDIAAYLYTTPIGRMLITAVYVTFTFNVALFTWLYYDI